MMVRQTLCVYQKYSYRTTNSNLPTLSTTGTAAAEWLETVCFAPNYKEISMAQICMRNPFAAFCCGESLTQIDNQFVTAARQFITAWCMEKARWGAQEAQKKNAKKKVRGDEEMLHLCNPIREKFDEFSI